MESEVPGKDLSLNRPKSREISQKKTKNRIKVVQIVDEVNEKNNKTNVFNYDSIDMQLMHMKMMLKVLR